MKTIRITIFKLFLIVAGVIPSGDSPASCSAYWSMYWSKIKARALNGFSTTKRAEVITHFDDRVLGARGKAYSEFMHRPNSLSYRTHSGNKATVRGMSRLFPNSQSTLVFKYTFKRFGSLGDDIEMELIFKSYEKIDATLWVNELSNEPLLSSVDLSDAVSVGSYTASVRFRTDTIVGVRETFDFYQRLHSLIDSSYRRNGFSPFKANFD